MAGNDDHTRADWALLDNVRAEWPLSSLDRARDLQQYEHALVLYERDDYPTMMRCATLFATALAHSVHGDGILTGDDVPNTVHKTIYCALCAPPDGRTFADAAQRAARLAMTVMRENGWHPPAFGGTVPFFEPMMTDPGNRQLLSAAIAPPNEPWNGDLNRFFAVPPTPTIGVLPNPDAARGRESIDHIHEVVQRAEGGDTASALYVEGMAAASRGDYEGAVARYREAADLGSIDAMASAGDLTSEMGRLEESGAWYERAAEAGHPVGMFNVAIAAVQRGDRASATGWFQRAAEAGNVEGFAALTQLASEDGNEAAEAHWARRGADAGHLFCIARHGLFLARDADGDVPTLRRARDVVEQAAERGDVDSMVLAVSLNAQLGDAGRGRRFVDMVAGSGDAEAIDRLRRYGFL